MSMNRRQFLKVGLSGLAYFTLEATTPKWVMRAARALPLNCLTNGRILVILQQSGGNDGLNTVIPRSDPIYYDALTRPTIRIPQGQEINLDGLNGLHPKMAEIADWYQQGKVSILQSVGYVNPDFSHFTSTDYWETGAVPGQPIPPQGWVSRFYDNSCAGQGDGEALFMAATGTSTVPDMLSGSQNYVPPAIADATKYALKASADKTHRLAAIHTMNNLPTLDSDIDFLQRSVNTVEASSADIALAQAMESPAPNGYTTDSLGNGLKLASKIIRKGFNTRIFYVSQGGYDTHANQVGAGMDVTATGDHQKLLGNLSRNVDSFLFEMQASGNLDRVLILTFSEFGRRIAENGSSGTDHGAANVMFAFGGGVNGGVFGGQPNLANPIKGNLRHSLDFRSVYGAIIENWFGGSAAPVFGQPTYDSIIAPQMGDLQFIKGSSAVKGWNQYG